MTRTDTDEHVSQLEARLAAAADEVQRAEDHLKAERERRDELIVEAVDGGYLSQSRVSLLVELSRARVERILAAY